MFTKLEGDQVLLASNGVYKPCDLYDLHGDLYAAYGGGYVRLWASGATSKDKVKIVHLVCERPLFQDRFTRLCLRGGDGRKPLAQEEAKVLRLVG